MKRYLREIYWEMNYNSNRDKAILSAYIVQRRQDYYSRDLYVLISCTVNDLIILRQAGNNVNVENTIYIDIKRMMLKHGLVLYVWPTRWMGCTYNFPYFMHI